MKRCNVATYWPVTSMSNTVARMCRLRGVGLLGSYGESQWSLANFTVPSECPCVCAFAPHQSVTGNWRTTYDFGSTTHSSIYHLLAHQCYIEWGHYAWFAALCVDGTYHRYSFTREGLCNRLAYDIYLDVTESMDFWDSSVRPALLMRKTVAMFGECMYTGPVQTLCS